MKTCNFFLTLLIGFILLTTQALALVDYTESEDEAPAPKKDNRIKINKPPRNSMSAASPRSSSTSGGSWGDFAVTSNYQSTNVEVGDRSGKVSAWHFDGHFQTNYGFYLSAHHFMASSDSSDLAEMSDMQQGNPKAKIGFNWLRFGGGSEAATIDILAGASFGQSNSDFATKRTDKIFGVETTKKIAALLIGLGYEYRITGAADESELAIGNIQKIYAVLGWIATPTIRFSFEGGTHRIGMGEGEYSLGEKTSFGYAAPNVHLALSPIVSLDLGAVFRTKRLKDDSLIDARLYDLKGAYGSSLVAGLSISL